MNESVWQTEDFEMTNPKKQNMKSLTSRRHYAVAILQFCEVPIEINARTEALLKRVEAALTAYKTNRGKIHVEGN